MMVIIPSIVVLKRMTVDPHDEVSTVEMIQDGSGRGREGR